MKACSNTFLSSTFWSERIGLVAAIETLKIMKKKRTWITIKKYGKYIKEQWHKLSKKKQYSA